MKIKISKSQWEGIGKKAGWIKLAMTHKEIANGKGLARPCSVHDLITVDEGLQCGNCLALSRDHGQTWEENDNKVAARQRVTKPQNIIDVPKKVDDEVPKRRVVKITFSDGDTITTWINGTKKDILKYYLPYGNRGPDQDYDTAHPERVRHAINVEFLDNVEPL